MRIAVFLQGAGWICALAVGSAAPAGAQEVPPAPVVALDRSIEVTQGIQNSQGNITLISGRPTWVRVYLAALAPGLGPMQGSLRIHTPGGHRDIPSSGITASLPTAGGSDRRLLGPSMNFRLPGDATIPGTVQLELLEVHDAATRQDLPCADCRVRSAAATFAPPTVLRLRLVGLRYFRGRLLAPRDVDFAAIRSWVSRAFPVSELLIDTVTVDVRTAAPSCESMNIVLARIRALDLAGGQDARTHYYGLVRDAGVYRTPEFMRGCSLGIPDGPDASTVASGAAGAPIPDTPDLEWGGRPSYAGWYAGHELAHTLGRRHPGRCGQTLDDAEVDTALGGRIGRGDEGDLGMDPVTGALYPEWYDIMTYCRFRWISGPIYEGILRRLREEDALYAQPVAATSPLVGSSETQSTAEVNADSLLEVIAELNDLPEHSVTGFSAFLVSRRGRPASYDEAVLDTISDERRIDIELAFGQGRARYPAWIMINRPRAAYAAADAVLPERRTGRGWVHAFVPTLPGAGWVLLRRNGQVLDSLPKSALPPRLDTLSHAIATDFTFATLGHLYTFRATDPDDVDERVTIYAQASFNGGATWLTVQQTEFDRILIPCALLQGKSSARVRLIASDGVNQAVVFPGEELVQQQNDPCAPQR